jgi:hypothetical protein
MRRGLPPNKGKPRDGLDYGMRNAGQVSQFPRDGHRGVLQAFVVDHSVDQAPALELSRSQ